MKGFKIKVSFRFSGKRSFNTQSGEDIRRKGGESNFFDEIALRFILDMKQKKELCSEKNIRMLNVKNWKKLFLAFAQQPEYNK